MGDTEGQVMPVLFILLGLAALGVGLWLLSPALLLCIAGLFSVAHGLRLHKEAHHG